MRGARESLFGRPSPSPLSGWLAPSAPAVGLRRLLPSGRWPGLPQAAKPAGSARSILLPLGARCRKAQRWLWVFMHRRRMTVPSSSSTELLRVYLRARLSDIGPERLAALVDRLVVPEEASA